jgi:hypothetical protein
MRGRALLEMNIRASEEDLPHGYNPDTDYLWIGKLGWTQQTYPFYTDWVKGYCEGTIGPFSNVPDTPIFFGQSNVNPGNDVSYYSIGEYVDIDDPNPLHFLSYFPLLRHLYYYTPPLTEHAVPEEFIDQEMTEQRFTELRDQYRRELLAMIDLKAPRAVSLYRSYLSIYGIDPEKYPIALIIGPDGQPIRDANGNTVEHPLSLRQLHLKWTKPNIRHPEYLPSHFPRNKLAIRLSANNYWKLTPFKAPYTQNDARSLDGSTIRTVKRIEVIDYGITNQYIRPLVDANTAALTALLREREDDDDPPLLANTPNFDLNYAVPLVPRTGIQDEETGEWDNDLSEESPSFVHAVM